MKCSLMIWKTNHHVASGQVKIEGMGNSLDTSPLCLLGVAASH